MSEHIVKRHNKNLMLYHVVCPIKYRKKVISEAVAKTMVEVCLGIGERYEMHFVEIGTDEDHVHFLIQSVPVMSGSRMVQTVKSITAKEILKKHEEIKEELWGGKFWTSGYYINTVGRYGNEEIIQAYVKGQGRKYERVYRNQLKMFEGLA